MRDEPRFCDHEEVHTVEGELLVTRCRRCPSTAVADPSRGQRWRRLEPFLLDDPTTGEEWSGERERVRDWPTIVVEDRYAGVYSGGAWLAFQPDDWPGMDSDAFGPDPECAGWWDEHEAAAIGRDDSPDLAVADLERRLVLRAYRDGRP